MNERDDMNPDTAGLTVTVLENPAAAVVEAALDGDMAQAEQLLADWDEPDLCELNWNLLDLRSLVEARIAALNSADEESTPDAGEVTR